MNIIQLHIFLLMWSQVTESLKNIAVSLGADVIISCDLDIKEIYWYKQKLPDPPVLILRTYDRISEAAKYENSTFKDKYLVKTNSSLFIRNISIDELGVYYCAKTSEPQKLDNGTKIYISDCVHKNQTSESNESEPNDASQQQIPWRNLTIASALLNVLLIIALMGLGKSYLRQEDLKKVQGILKVPHQHNARLIHSMLKLNFPCTPVKTGLARSRASTLFYNQ
ncbi:hypothetical protein QQF64_018828 [Cirrhinus molitorella]|uniref:Ig-like domain-containing protein n=1 Tax=Cirrhinus molitorella TaxID=172907 RepID=A0ABR3LDR7_9TELE